MSSSPGRITNANFDKTKFGAHGFGQKDVDELVRRGHTYKQINNYVKRQKKQHGDQFGTGAADALAKLQRSSGGGKKNPGMVINDKGRIKGGIKNYDPKAYGADGKFGKRDRAALQSMGYNDKQIDKHIRNNLNRGQVKSGQQIQAGKDLPQDVSNLNNYDTNSIGNTGFHSGNANSKQKDLDKKEIQYLMEKGGHSARDLNDWIKSNGKTVNNKGQKFLNERLTAMTNQPPTDVTDPKDGTPVVETDPGPPAVGGPTVGGDVVGGDKTGGDKVGGDKAGGDIVGGDKDFVLGDKTDVGGDNKGIIGDDNVQVGGDNKGNIGDDNQNIGGDNKGIQNDGDNNENIVVGGDNKGGIGDGSVSTGGGDMTNQIGKVAGDTNIDVNNSDFGAGSNVNIGNDYSVTIGNQGIGGVGGQAGEKTGALDNMMGAASYTALNNNQHARSQSQLSGVSRATQAIKAAEELTGSTKRIAGLDYAARMNPMYWDAKAKQQTNMYLGDIWNFGGFDWQSADPLKPIDSRIDELTNK